MELAIAGCGRIATVHLEAIKQLTQNNYDISITSLIDTSEKNARIFKDKHKITCPIFTNIDDALNKSKFDSIIVCIPHVFHEIISLKCFNANKNVLLEKPMAHNLKSAHKILSASLNTKKLFMIAESSHYWPEVLKVKDLLRNNKIGKIVTCKASFRQCSENDIFDSYNLLPGDNIKKAWRFSKDFTGGGITIDGGAHWIRPLREWFGNVKQTICKFSYPHPHMEGESLSQAIFLFDNDITAIFEGILTETTTFCNDTPFRITGTLGEITIGPNGLGVFLYNKENPNGKRVLNDNGYISSFYYQFKDFFDSIKNNTCPQASPLYSLGEMETALAMEKSDNLQKWITIDYTNL